MNKHSFPVDAVGDPIHDLTEPGYYPDFSTMRQKKTWDLATQNVVTARVGGIPRIRFFSAEEARLLEAIVDRLLPQDDRAESRTIPIVPVIDERLFKNAINGFRYEDMPSDREAYPMGIQAIHEMAQQRFGGPFIELSVAYQEIILKSLHDGKPNPDHDIWKRMPVHRFWALLLEDCVSAYYAHPWAWDEIGFGGPAYPRGYMRLENGLPEPWETDEMRYVWRAPVDSLSDLASVRTDDDPSATRGDTD